ncbi:MAG TPA: S49 family peptidase, partial [Vicinamibacterales bacterium]|nr:S49 family peptidase [Vicinamibacterales bacterium]
SCGAYLLHQDISKMLENWGIKMTFIYAGEHKVEGNMFEPLSDDAKTHFQDEINQVKGWFDAALARARGVSVKHVLENFGQGRMFYGQAAVKAGLADKVATFDAVIGRLQGRKRTGVPVATASAVQATGDHINEGDGGPTMMADDVARNATTPSADVPASAAVEPDVDGQCPEGYELRDGQCHRRNDDDEDARAAAERDAVNIAIALSE